MPAPPVRLAVAAAVLEELVATEADVTESETARETAEEVEDAAGVVVVVAKVGE